MTILGSDPYLVGKAKPIRQSELAILFYIEETNEDVWIPKSGIHEYSEVWKYPQEEGELVVMMWLARKREWTSE